jgi:hypothetical protein
VTGTCDKEDCHHEGSNLFSIFRFSQPDNVPLQLRNFYTKIRYLSGRKELVVHHTKCFDKIDQHYLLQRFCDPPIFLSGRYVCVPFGAFLRFLSFNRTQSRAVTGFLTGHNTLRRHLHLLGLLDIPLCMWCGAEEETSAHILCECEALASLRHAHPGSFFLEPEDNKNISLGAIWNFSKVTGLP